MRERDFVMYIFVFSLTISGWWGIGKEIAKLNERLEKTETRLQIERH